jgi:uncharacterized membrane protein YcgQ (UPF0703/DUF1980 family)
MKKKILWISVCVILALSGCQGQSPVNQSEKNGNGTPAVNLTDNSVQTADSDNIEVDDSTVQAASKDVLEIKEKMFIAQTNDIYFNAEDYIGKTIKYQGIFSIFEVPETGVTYYSVIRYGPGCCGIDANAGFEVIWNKDYPKQDDWVEAVGVLEEYEEDGNKYLRLALTSLTVLPTRGAEYVSQ